MDKVEIHKHKKIMVTNNMDTLTKYPKSMKPCITTHMNTSQSKKRNTYQQQHEVQLCWVLERPYHIMFRHRPTVGYVVSLRRMRGIIKLKQH